MPERPQVDFADVIPRLLVQPAQHGRVVHRPELGQLASAEQPNRFVLVGPPHDRALRRTRIGGGQFQGRRADIIAAAEPNRDATRGQLVFLPQRAGRVPGCLECGKRLRFSARVGIVAGRRNVVVSGANQL